MFAVTAVATSDVEALESVETSSIHCPLARWHYCEESKSTSVHKH